MSKKYINADALIERKYIPSFEGKYEVDKTGRVFNSKTGAELKQQITTNGYKSVALYKNGKYIHVRVHRAVAMAFIENPNNISRQAAIDALDKIFPADPMRNDYTQGIACGAALATEYIEQLPSAQPDSCKGCKHMGLWENEVENGYPSPCTRCKRRASDNYER